jgi:hypothetical protein
MPVKYFAPKVTVKLCIIDFPPRDNRGQNNEQLFIPTVPVEQFYNNKEIEEAH